MKTVNKDVYFFTTEEKARREYNKRAEPTRLLKTTRGYFVERRTQTIGLLENWPKLYTLISEK